MGCMVWSDIKMEFVMHLGRTGEAYFVEEKGEHEESCSNERKAILLKNP